MTRLASTRTRLTAVVLVAAVAAAPATVVGSLAHPPDALAKKKKKSCEGGNAGEFFKHGQYERLSSRNPNGSVDHYRRKCNNGRWGDWEKTGTSGPAVSYPGSSDGSEGGPIV